MTEPSTDPADQSGPGRRCRDHRRGAGGADRGLPAGEGGPALDRAGGGQRGWRDQPDGGARRLALRHRRPPLFHQGPAGGGALARDPARRRFHAAAPQEPDLLPGQVLRLPARAINALAQPRAARGGPLRPFLRSGPGCDPPKRQDMYEGWLAARFGWRLYRHFFQTYTEKVWGHPPRRCPPTGRPSGSRTCRLHPPSSTPCCPSATRRTSRP